MTRPLNHTFLPIAKLFKLGVHLGHPDYHQSNNGYILGYRPFQQNVAIIDLDKTVVSLNSAYQVVYDVAMNRGQILFTGVPNLPSIWSRIIQLQHSYISIGQYLEGTLTNFENTYKFVSHSLTHKRAKGLDYHKGLANLTMLPDLVICLSYDDKTRVVLKEASVLDIPTIAFLDTNQSSNNVLWPVLVGNSNLETTELYLEFLLDAIYHGQQEEAIQLIS